MNSWLTKLDRAEHHIVELRSEVDFFLAPDSVAVEYELQDGGRRLVARLRVSQPVPDHWAAIIGDAVHNVRSALDHLAFHLARSGKGSDLTEAEARGVQFPITKTAGEFQAQIGQKLFSVTQPAVGAIETLQPFWSVDQTTGLSSAERLAAIDGHSLAVLNRLSNLDKHRHPHLAVTTPNRAISSGLPGVQSAFSWGQRPFVDGSEIGRWEADKPITRDAIQPSFKFVIALDEKVGPAGPYPIVDRLITLHACARDDVLPALATFI